jgi:Protein of unknown function (DUF2786)
MTDMKRVLDRIRAFLNMAESPNEAEAATAMEMAHRMLKEHNLSLSDLELKKQEILENEYEQFHEMPVWKDQLLMQICKTFYCESYRHHFTDISKWIIVGRSDNVATVKVTADYLLGAIDRWTDKYEPETEEEGEDYKTGMADTLRARLIQMTNREEKIEASSPWGSTERALTVRENALVQKYMADKKNMRKSEAPDLKVTDLDAYLKGLGDGKKISLATQLSTQNSKRHAVIERS